MIYLKHATLATAISPCDKVDPLVGLPSELRMAHEVVNVHLQEVCSKFDKTDLNKDTDPLNDTNNTILICLNSLLPCSSGRRGVITTVLI